MAQAQPEEKPTEDSREKETMKDTITQGSDDSSSGAGANGVSFKFNAQAPEFVPRSHTQMPMSGYFYPYFRYLGGSTSGSDWFFVGDQEPAAFFISNPSVSLPYAKSSSSKSILSDDLRLKIIKHVEYQFSDMSLLANEYLSKQISKDVEGYVPISVVASAKKIRSLTSNHHLIAQALRSSSKLIVNEDGKKIKRKYPFIEKDREELQSRTVVAENLPEDHSYQNLEKIFGVVGRMKTIRICHPQESNPSRPKGDFLVSNKLHALVEYESADIAEKAVEKLNDERNWRKGLRVRLLLRCSPKSVLKNRKSDFDGLLEDEDAPASESIEDYLQSNNIESGTENNAEENSGGLKRGWAKGRGKGRGRVQSHGGRGLLAPSPQSSTATQFEVTGKQTTRGPRMPDGTRGFTMGRGKPLNLTVE